MLPVSLLCPPVMMMESPVETAQDLDMTRGSGGPWLQDFSPVSSNVSTLDRPAPPM